MNIIQAIAYFFKAIGEYYSYKAKSFYRNSYLDSNKAQQELIYEIEKLRDTGISADADRADFLRELLKEERRFIKSIESISTQHTSVTTEDTGSD